MCWICSLTYVATRLILILALCNWKNTGTRNSTGTGLQVSVPDAMGDLMSHWVGEGNYACETGWPNMRLTLSHDGWLGIAPSNKEILMRSLDFWRLQDGLIRENWVLVDLLDVHRQIGVDVLARMREFNKARQGASVVVPDAMQA